MFQYKSAPFKVAEFYRWTVVLSSREHVEELRRAPDDALSFAVAVNDVNNYFPPVRLTCTECHRQVLQQKYTIGPEIYHNPYHVPIVRLQLTRNIEALLPGMRNEIAMAFDDVLDLRGNGEHLAPVHVYC